MAIDFTRVWNWYSRESVQKALLEVAKNREVVSVFKEGNFGKRPDVINYQGDVLQAVANGTVSFHGSVERWHQPMKLDVGMTKPELDKLRSGWEILVDPDVPDFEIAKAVTGRIVSALKDHGINSYSVKFTGGKGFHIAVPFEALPDKINLQETQTLYPDLLQKIIEYLKWYTKDQLKEAILEVDTPNNISQRIGKSLNDIVNQEGLDPFKIVSMDIFSSRHLFRLPYSLHEKSLFVSLPIKIQNIDSFKKEDALPEKVKVDEKFLSPKGFIHDAEVFVIEALDWASKHIAEIKLSVPEERKKFAKTRFVPEEYFPPCIREILKGRSDGRKRCVFILINFLRNMGWGIGQIEKKLAEWNEKNYPPLRTNYIRSQLRWHFSQDRNLLPPNCDNGNFYKQMGLYDICNEEVDHANMNIKNPVNYPFRKMKTGGKPRNNPNRKPKLS